MPIKITDPELTVLEVLWRRYPMTMQELAEALASTGWKASTIASLIKQMLKKGIVIEESENGGYRPMFSRSRYREQLREGFLKRWYKGSVPRMLREVLEEEALTADEVAELRRMLNAVAENRED